MEAQASTATPVAMLPADQVAAMIEQMKLDQARLLKEQQQVIVQQVVKSLLESGVTAADAPLLTRTKKAKASKPRHQSLSKLEHKLHALVLHSLDESGLKYPHVQQNAYAASTNDPSPDLLHHTRPAAQAAVRTHSRTIVVSRSECESLSTEEHDTPSAQGSREQCGGEMSAQQASSAERARPSRVDPLRASPLLCARGRTQHKQSKGRGRRGRKSVTRVDTSMDDDDDLNAVRGKVGRNTLAILNRSRALLNEMKQLQPKRTGGVNGDSTFVDRMRQRLIEADAVGEDDARKPAKEDTGIKAAEEAAQDAMARAKSSRQRARPCSSGHVRQGDTLLEDATRPLRVTCEDIEILRPPAHSPENENEWENELARQILTIYATSVQAKAANRPSSRAGTRAADPTGTTRSAPRLTGSCSLPAIGKASVTTLQQNASPLRAVVHYSWAPSQRLDDGKVVVNMPKVPKPIWFAGTGAVKAVWCALAEGFQSLHASASPSKAKRHPHSGATAVCDHQLCEELRRLEAKQQYSQCVTSLETLLISLVRARGVDSLETKLWKQLVVTCNAFASRCVDYKKFSAALQLIQQAEHLLHNSILVDDAMRLELRAYLYDTYAHYYFKRGKSHAGLQYMHKAHEIHTRQRSWAHLAKCPLHIANLLSAQGKHCDAMQYMASILELIEDSKLEDEGSDNRSSDGAASAQKICLAAVCYNNLAIEQLHLRAFEAASVSAGNAQRLAKLCLSYSNRWLAQFDATSHCVDLAIATLMEDVNAASNAPYKAA